MRRAGHVVSMVKPSTQEWLSSARNHVEYANDGGYYSDVADYLAGAGKAKRRSVGFL